MFLTVSFLLDSSSIWIVCDLLFHFFQQCVVSDSKKGSGPINNDFAPFCWVDRHLVIFHSGIHRRVTEISILSSFSFLRHSQTILELTTFEHSSFMAAWLLDIMTILCPDISFLCLSRSICELSELLLDRGLGLFSSFLSVYL